jgi:hypothetical protein
VTNPSSVSVKILRLVSMDWSADVLAKPLLASSKGQIVTPSCSEADVVGTSSFLIRVRLVLAIVFPETNRANVVSGSFVERRVATAWTCEFAVAHTQPIET